MYKNLELLQTRRRGRRRQTLLGRRWGWGGEAKQGGTIPVMRTTGENWSADFWSLWSMSWDLTTKDHCPCWWAVLIVVLLCTVIALSFLHIWNPCTRCFKSNTHKQNWSCFRASSSPVKNQFAQFCAWPAPWKKHDYVHHCAPIVQIYIT